MSSSGEKANPVPASSAADTAASSASAGVPLVAGESTGIQEIIEEIDSAVVLGKKGHEKKAEANAAAASAAAASSEAVVDVSKLSDAQLMQYLQEKEFRKMRERQIRAELKGKEVEKEHKFWNTQPVPSISETILEGNGPIDQSQTVESVRQEPYNMPKGFEWYAVDVMDPKEITDVYNLLNANYVEDDEATFRFDYSVAFLQWALTLPGYLRDWHVGVRNQKTGALMGFITAVPVDVRVYGKTSSMAEINFLCVHKKLRTKRLAPVLIKEITRRVNLTNRWQAVYTAGIVLPKPVAKCRYYHRSLNPKKLIECKFSYLPQKMTMAGLIKNLKLPNQPSTPGLRPMTPEDVSGVHKLLTSYLEKSTELSQAFSEPEVAHMFLPREGVVQCYVVPGASPGTVTDMCSFYHLPSTVIGHPVHKVLHAVYSFYNIASTVPVVSLMRDLLVLARTTGADVFNALDVMENNAPVSSVPSNLAQIEVSEPQKGDSGAEIVAAAAAVATEGEGGSGGKGKGKGRGKKTSAQKVSGDTTSSSTVTNKTPADQEEIGEKGEEEKSIFDELKFGRGDGCLQYYVYNWKCPPIDPPKVGLVLL